jgi:hypothetical protein
MNAALFASGARRNGITAASVCGVRKRAAVWKGMAFNTTT